MSRCACTYELYLALNPSLPTNRRWVLILNNPETGKCVWYYTQPLHTTTNANAQFEAQSDTGGTKNEQPAVYTRTRSQTQSFKPHPFSEILQIGSIEASKIPLFEEIFNEMDLMSNHLFCAFFLLALAEEGMVEMAVVCDVVWAATCKGYEWMFLSFETEADWEEPVGEVSDEEDDDDESNEAEEEEEADCEGGQGEQDPLLADEENDEVVGCLQDVLGDFMYVWSALL